MRIVHSLFLVSLFSLSLSAQVSANGTTPSGNGQSLTADDVIAKYVKTAGGMAALDAMKTLRRTGRFRDSTGFQATFAQEQQRPDKIRQDFTFSGMTGITAWDGKTAWSLQPFGGKKDPRTLSDDDRKGIVDEADFEDPFLRYREKGNKVEYLGTDSIEGTETYKLKVTLASTGDVLTYYMDTDSGMPIKIDTMSIVRGAPQESETIIGDYKKVDGWYLPFSTESNTKGSTYKQSITWDKIQANADIPASRFTMPETRSAK